jgi:beta-lactamase regulating signal transducer with metallopeptidase domain
MVALLVAAIKASLILAIGIAISIGLRRRSAAVRHWVLATAMVYAGAAPLLAVVMPTWTIPALALPTSDGNVDVSIRTQPARDGSSAPSHGGLVSDAVTTPTGISGVFVPVWIVGVVLNLFVLLIGMLQLRRLRSPVADVHFDAVARSLQDLSQLFGVLLRVTLVQSNRPGVPMTWGVVWPKILVPSDIDQWPRERIDMVLAHELAHVTRGDWLLQMIAEVLRAIYWFNPLFWIACARLRQEGEYACDDAVINIGVDSRAYATELVEVARRVGRHRQQWLPAPAMVARRSSLERRVLAMLSARVERGPITRRGRWALAVALLALMLPIASFAQGGFETFSGVVVDQQDRLLPAATVTLSDALRNVKHETKTDSNGHFELVGLPSGNYTYEATLPGFRNLTGSVAIQGESVQRTMKMQVGLLQETIRVTSDNGAITNAYQRGNAVAKRPVFPCSTAMATGVGGNIRPPRKVKHVAPGYPGVDRNVELSATIGTDGSVVDVQVVKADQPELEPAAIDAVRQWEFDSTLLNCVPIEVQMNVSITFRRAP